MTDGLEYFLSSGDRIPVPFAVLSKEGNLIKAGDSFLKLYPSFKKDDRLSYFFPKAMTDSVLASKELKRLPLPDKSAVMTVLPFSDCVVIFIFKEPAPKEENILTGSVLEALPSVMSPSVSKIFSSATQLYALADRLECEEVFEIAKRINLSCYQILRSEKLIKSFCQALAPQDAEKGKISDLSSLLKVICSSAKLVINAFGCDLIYDVADEAVPVFCDEEEITEAVISILDNAVKYNMGDNINLKLKTIGDKAVIHISDRGIGIPGNIMDDVFKPFFTFTREVGDPKGLGLGLTVARLTALKWGGNVSVSSKDYGGTTVTITLPLKKDGEISLQSDITPLHLLSDRFSPLHVLFADNNIVPLP